MFWTYNTTSPQIDIILCKEDLTLQELLDQENVLQELKAQNLKLIEFLIKPEVLRELVTLITSEPSPEVDVSEQYRYPNLACELLTSDLPALNERLASEEILNKLYCFLQNDSPLNPLLSSYFSRTLSILISRKSEQNWFSYQYTCLQTLEFLKAKEEFLKLLLKHMGTSSIMDLMHNLVTLIEGPELKLSLWNWLQSQNVIPSLITLLGPSVDEDCQTNTASLLCSIIQKLRENLLELNDKSVFDPILQLLESAEVMELMLNTVFNSDTLCDTSIESGIDVLLTLIQPYLPGDARCRQALNYTVHDKMESGLLISSNISNVIIRNDSVNDSDDSNNQKPVSPSEIIGAIVPFIAKFKNILMNPLKKEPIKLTSGIICPPFGKTRLLITKLIVVLSSLNSSEINEEIMRCDIPELLLDLFYAYSSNNFLHTEVEKLIAYAIDFINEAGPVEGSECLFAHLLNKCNLLKRLLDIWEKNIETENSGQCRRGYMGHVIRIATLIHIETEKSLLFREMMKENSPEVLCDWNTFVNDTVKVIIEKHSSCLGGIRPKLCQSNDNSFEENVSNKDIKTEFKDFEQVDDQNIMFSNDPALMDYGDESYKLNNGFSDEVQSRMFDSICAQKWQSFTKGLNNLDDDDNGDEHGQNFRWRGIQNWDSDDENIDEESQNVSDLWSKLGNVSDPWANNTNSESSDSSWNSSGDANWAKFEENFGESFSSNEDIDGVAAQARSPSATYIDQFGVFMDEININNGDSISEKSNILDNFSDVKISSSNLNADQRESQRNNSNGSNWSIETCDGSSKSDDESNGYIMQQEYNCFDEQGKDEMLNLECIYGNTLAEKLANAENDIRNKDEEEQQQQQTLQNNMRMASNLDETREQILCNSNKCDIKVHVTSSKSEEISDDEKLYDQNASYLSQQDCLTENSFDFVTAENSTSDAESSMEFADAENSLDLEEEEDAIMEQSCSSPIEELSPSPTNHSEPEILVVDDVPVDTNKADHLCNKEEIEKDIEENEDSQIEECTSNEMEGTGEFDAELSKSINSIVNDHSVLKGCDKNEDFRNSPDFVNDETKPNLCSTVIEEPT